MKKRLLTVIQILFFMGLGLGLIYWRYLEMSEVDKQAMFDAFDNINWWMLLPIAIVGFFSHLFRALRWQILLKTVDMRPSVANVTYAVLIGYLANTVVPRLGEIAKCTVLAKYEHTAPDKAIGTIIGERAFDMISLLLIIVLVLVLEQNVAITLLNTYFGKYFIADGSWQWQPIALLAIIAILAIFGFVYLLRKSKHTKVGKIITSLGEGIASVWRMKERTSFFVYTLLIWLFYTLVVYLAFYALDATTGLSFSASLAIIAFGSIGMIVTPGGIGAYPLIVAGVLILFGINEGVGMAFGWICWCIQTVLILILGLASLILLPLTNGTKNQQQIRPT
jgi:uncharacterized protein (TIRG00374 family)